MKNLVAFCGAAGAGKDEAARALMDFGLFERRSFAAKMREAMLALDPWVFEPEKNWQPIRLSQIVETWGWDHAKRTYPEARRLLQRFGTEAGRDIHGTDCWVDALFAEFRGDVMGHQIVISDLRFPNEAEAIKDYCGLIIKIERPGLEVLPGNHASEAGIPDDLCDHVVFNSGSIEDLHRVIRRIVETS